MTKITKEIFRDQLRLAYAVSAEEQEKVINFVTKGEENHDKYRKLKVRYNEREGLVEGIAELVEKKLDGLAEEKKEKARTKILSSLMEDQVLGTVNSFLEERADSGFGFTGIGKSAAKKVFLDNVDEAVPRTILGNLVTLIDNAVEIAKNPEAKIKPITEIAIPETGNNYYFYPNLKDAMIGSLTEKLEAKFKELESGKSQDELKHLQESILTSLDDEKLDRLLGTMAGQNGYVRSLDAKDLKTAKKQLKTEDEALEAIIEEAVTEGKAKEARIAAGKEKRGEDPSLDEPSNNTFLKMAIYGMMLSAQAIQGYNAIAPSSYRTTPSRAAGNSRGDSTALDISRPIRTEASISLADRGFSPALGTSTLQPTAMVPQVDVNGLINPHTSMNTGVTLRTDGHSSIFEALPIPGPYEVVTATDATTLRTIDSRSTGLALGTSDLSSTLGTSSIPGPGAIITSTDAATLRRTDSMNASLASGTGEMVAHGSSVFFNNLGLFTQAFVQNPDDLSRTTSTQRDELLNFLQQLAAQGRAEIAPVDRESAQSTALVATSQITRQNKQVITAFEGLSSDFLKKIPTSDQERFLPVFQNLGSILRDVNLAGNNLSELLGATVNTTNRSPRLMIEGPSTGVSVTDLGLVPTGTEVSISHDTSLTSTSPVISPNATRFQQAAVDLSQSIRDLNRSLSTTSVGVTGISKSVIPGREKQVGVVTTPTTNLDALSVTDTSRTSGPGLGTALDSVNVVNTTVTPTNVLDAIQVTSTDPEVTTSKAKATAKPRKPILSPDDTFAAHKKTVGLLTKSYDNKIKDLHELKTDLGTLKEELEGLKQKGPDFAKDPEFIEKQYKFAKKQFEVTQAENFLRKGRETGGQYREHQLAVLEAEVAAGKTEKKREAAERGIMLANSNISKFSSNLESLAGKVASEKEDKDRAKALAAYRSAALVILNEEKAKAKSIQAYVDENSQASKIDEYKAASDKLIEHLQKAKDLTAESFAEFEKERKKLSTDAGKEYRLGKSLEGMDFSTSHSNPKEKDKAKSSTQEPSPYEIWLCKEAEKKYEHDNKGKKFDELSEEEQYKYNKQFVYTNRSAKINEYEESLSSAGKVTGRSNGTSKTFELSGGTAIKFEVGFNGLLTPTVDGDLSKLNAVVRVQRKRSNGTLSTVSDMIEFKDGKIVGFHLNTEKDPAGPTTSQLNISAIESLAKNLNIEAEKAAAQKQTTTSTPSVTDKPTGVSDTVTSVTSQRTTTDKPTGVSDTVTSVTSQRTATDKPTDVSDTVTSVTSQRTATSTSTSTLDTEHSVPPKQTATETSTKTPRIYSNPKSPTSNGNPLGGNPKDIAATLVGGSTTRSTDSHAPVHREHTDRSPVSLTKSPTTGVDITSVLISDTRVGGSVIKPTSTPTKDSTGNTHGHGSL